MKACARGPAYWLAGDRSQDGHIADVVSGVDGLRPLDTAHQYAGAAKNTTLMAT